MSVFEDKQRIIQEFVPGKQVTLAHLIANPDRELYKKLGVVGGIQEALGIMTITPARRPSSALTPPPRPPV